MKCGQIYTGHVTPHGPPAATKLSGWPVPHACIAALSRMRRGLCCAASDVKPCDCVRAQRGRGRPRAAALGGVQGLPGHAAPAAGGRRGPGARRPRGLHAPALGRPPRQRRGRHAAAAGAPRPRALRQVCVWSVLPGLCWAATPWSLISALLQALCGVSSEQLAAHQDSCTSVTGSSSGRGWLRLMASVCHERRHTLVRKPSLSNIVLKAMGHKC